MVFTIIIIIPSTTVRRTNTILAHSAHTRTRVMRAPRPARLEFESRGGGGGDVLSGRWPCGRRCRFSTRRRVGAAVMSFVFGVDRDRRPAGRRKNISNWFRRGRATVASRVRRNLVLGGFSSIAYSHPGHHPSPTAGTKAVCLL